MEEIQAAIEIAKAPVEIIKVPCEVGEIAVKIGNGLLEGLRNALYFVQSIREQYLKEKVTGKTNMKTLMKATGGDVMLVKVDEANVAQVKKAMKKWGVLYAEASDLNKADGKREIMFPTNASPRVLELMNKLGFVENQSFEIITPKQYVDNATPDKRAEYDEEIKKMKMTDPEQAVTPQKETKEMTPEMERMMHLSEFEACVNDPDLQTFTINERLVRSKTDNYIESRIPGTDDFVRMPKDRVFLKDNGKTYFVFVKSDSRLTVVGASGATEYVTAKDLYKASYRSRTVKVKPTTKVNASPLQSGQTR